MVLGNPDKFAILTEIIKEWKHLAKLAADKYLYGLPALQAFIEIYNITFSEDDRL